MIDNQKIWFGTNTKMYKNIADTKSFLFELKELTKDLEDVINLFVIPSYTSLKEAKEEVRNSFIKIGAQNMGPEDEGQFTGEISPLMLKEIDTDLVMIGHSERRHIFREDDFDEEKKIKKAFEHNLTPLLCVGETLIEKEYDIAYETLNSQLKIGLHDISKKDANNLLIAYEPVWSIGINGVPATKEYVAKTHLNIRNTLIKMFDEEVGNKIPILYGGSVNIDNCVDLISQDNVDGLFIGRSAWGANNFNKIIRKVLNNMEKR